ncbi:hypothetical protein LEP1GSC047_2305 [Leptospira inadai serovar Lyme str. 10]|uniref:Uncharacterized protein n=2 Tax=Leptospira inadai serovar Lyme TaxID=293084 RepID=V6HFM6_9LEPT|nr:hypothetical protein [Leptospira inadai]EQA38563.1 hypothetical protein LEP1GSC047_2305 [Leptospira inadai serovar Lyme str. 10]PNV72839.1 hypothetical protein BES34_018445 [Leptospira inadai serovar Lyme]
MYFAKWYSVEYFEERLGNVSQVQALRKILTIRDKTFSSTTGRKTSRILKNHIFIFRLLIKARLQSRQINWLRSQVLEQLKEIASLKDEMRSLRWEAANLRNELSLTRKALSFFKNVKGIYEKES